MTWSRRLHRAATGPCGSEPGTGWCDSGMARPNSLPGRTAWHRTASMPSSRRTMVPCGLAGGNIWTIYEDKDGILWIGTYDGGLERFADRKFTNYTVKDGLYDDSVFGILEDSSGYLWISSDHGIYQVSKADLNAFAAGTLRTITSIAYGKVDGMLTIQCNGGLWPSAARTSDGKLWFPTLDGVAVIDPATILHNRIPPAVTIESAQIDNLPAPIVNGLRI